MPRERIQHGKQYVEISKFKHGESEPSKVNSVEYVPGEPIPDGSIIREEPSLDLVWNREGGWVQIGFSAPRDWWERFFESHSHTPDVSELVAFTNVMPRSEINNMIRTLRRARDAAYGADE